MFFIKFGVRLKKESSHILDEEMSEPQVGSVDFDLKIVRGFALAFFLYGLVYWFEIGDFLVPLPMVYFFVPVAGLLMFVRSIKWIGSVALLLIPFIVIKDLTWNSYPNFTGVLALITFLVWSVWSIFVFKRKEEKNWKSWFFVASQQLIWLIWVVQIPVVQLVMALLILIGVTVFVREQINNVNQVYNVRVGLLIQLIIALFFLQKISILWVSLT